MFDATVLDEELGEFGAFAQGDHPAGDVTTEDIEDHVEVEVSPYRRAQKFGDVPTPELIGSGRQEFGLAIRGDG